MAEIIDSETGEITTLPAVRSSLQPSPYQSADTGQLAEAMAKAQGEMESPKRTKEGKIEGVAKSGNSYSYKYKYAPFEELQRVIKAAFPKHGLMYQQGLVMRGDQFFVRTYIRHLSGEWTASDFPVIGSDKAGPQGFAGATTYAKRYGLSLATGLAAEDDDDGEAAQAAVPEARPATRANPAVAQQSDQIQLASAAAQRIRKQIADAQSVEQLNQRGIYGPTAEADEQLIKAQPGGARVWDDLVRRDADRRIALAPPPDDDIPEQADEMASEIDDAIENGAETLQQAYEAALETLAVLPRPGPRQGTTDWSTTAQDMIAVIAKLTDAADTMPNGRFKQENRQTLEVMRGKDRSAWSDVETHLGARYRELSERKST